MAALQYCVVAQSTSFAAPISNRASNTKRRPLSVCYEQHRRKYFPQLRASADIQTSSPSLPEPSSSSIIELHFMSPDATADAQIAEVVSGEKLLRSIMLENKLELYGLYGKVMNCGGGGSCGTCIVEILDGHELLNDRTDTEYRHLKKKPESWRLACQTIVGDKTNSGKVVVRRLPQRK